MINLEILHFNKLNPPKNIGDQIDPNVEDFEYLSERITLNFEAKDYIDLSKIGNSEIKIYNLNDYILDFTNFNQGSVDVVLKYMMFGLRIKEDMSNLSYAC